MGAGTVNGKAVSHGKEAFLLFSLGIASPIRPSESERDNQKLSVGFGSRKLSEARRRLRIGKPGLVVKVRPGGVGGFYHLSHLQLPALSSSSQLSAPSSQLSALSSQLHSSSQLQLSALSSQLPAPSSQLSAPSSQLSAPALSSQLPALSSQLPAPASSSSSQLPAPSSQLSAPSSQLSALSSQLQLPALSFPALSSQLPAPRSLLSGSDCSYQRNRVAVENSRRDCVRHAQGAIDTAAMLLHRCLAAMQNLAGFPARFAYRQPMQHFPFTRRQVVQRRGLHRGREALGATFYQDGWRRATKIFCEKEAFHVKGKLPVSGVSAAPLEGDDRLPRPPPRTFRVLRRRSLSPAHSNRSARCCRRSRAAASRRSCRQSDPRKGYRAKS